MSGSTEKTNPPDGMAMAYLVGVKPHVWDGEGYSGPYGWYSPNEQAPDVHLA